MPDPMPNESHDDFMERCIPMLISEGRPQDQAVAVCNSMFEDAHKKAVNYSVKCLKQSADSATVAGYGVIYGGEDLDGENFQPDTDFMLDLVPVKLVMYDHAMQDEVTHVVGKATATPDNNGL